MLDLQPNEEYHKIFETKIKIWQENLIKQIDIK